MSAYLERLRDEYGKKGSMLCFGMDPVLEKMNIDGSRNLTDEIVGFFWGILSEIKQKVTAVKPNVAFYYQYGIDGIRALVELAAKARTLGIPVIIDAKNADIGKTSAAYAKYVFDVLGGDAVTLNPYMGYDSLAPFFAYTDRGFYVLALTSNAGAKDFQMASMDTGRFLYEHTLEKVCGWSNTHGSVGAVLGATQDRFRDCVERLTGRGCGIPLLVPGVGAQGASYVETAGILERFGYEKAVVRINASSSISYARKAMPSLSAAEAAAQAVEELFES